MRLSGRGWFRLILVAAAVALLWVRLVPRHPARKAAGSSIPDLAATSPLNQPGGGAVPADAYDVYSALYKAPVQEPLVFAENSVTDIPQVGGSCLRPATPDEHEMTDAFEAANRQSHDWQPKFAIPQGYQVLGRSQVARVQRCLQVHDQQVSGCDDYRKVRHVRFLGVPGFDRAHTRALVSVIRNCGGFCGSGGIFVVEKSGGTWRRAGTTDFTRDCSWMY